MTNEYPLVIWQGKQPLHPKSASLFRLVYRGPARAERPDDVPYSLERRGPPNMMKETTWLPVEGADKLRDALYALSHAFGLLLSVDPKRLNLDHPLWCELNLAVVEGREPRGCDCPKEAKAMRKRDELTDPASCLNKARDEEWLFVLLGRDEDAPAAVRAWIERRVGRGKARRTDPKIVEAESWIKVVVEELIASRSPRREELAEKKACGDLTEAEQAEFDRLQKEVEDLCASAWPAGGPTIEQLDAIRMRLQDRSGR